MSLCLESEFVETSPFRSTVGIPATFHLRVHQDKALLFAFIKGAFSPWDWSGLSLASFMSAGGPRLVVVDIVSSEGRRMLATALENLQLMMTCHFDVAFTSVFKELIDALLTTSVPELRQIHDLVLRYQVEVLIFKFFKDVFTSNRSEMFPECCLKTPAGWAELLRRYVGGFVRGLPNVPQQPHYLFYGSEGNAQNLLLDAGTFGALGLNKPSFRLNMQQAPRKVVGAPLAHVARPAGSRKATASLRAAAIPLGHKYCLWNWAEQFGLSTDKGPLVCKCPW
jgi:hypothetical protein